MVEPASNTSRLPVALSLGLLATVAAAATWWTGADRRIELAALDWRFRTFSPAAEPDGQAATIVHVDIDDNSLDELGRWPWDRATLAGMIDVLDECGARTIALDIILPEPQKTRYVDPTWDLYTTDSSELLGGGALPVFDDALLADAIADAGNVMIPMHVDFTGRRVIVSEPSIPPERLWESLQDESLPAESAEDRQTPAKQYLRIRATRTLRKLAVPLARVAPGFGMRADSVLPPQLRFGTIVPPLLPFINAAAGTGFVTIEPDVDGTVRRVPLLALPEHAGVQPQFALSLAVRELEFQAGEPAEIIADAGHVSIRFGDDVARRIPLDDEGMMIVNWIPPLAGRKSLAHLPAMQIAAVSDLRKARDDNRRRARLTQLRLARLLNHQPLVDLFARADELDGRVRELRYARSRLLLFARPELEQVEATLAALHEREKELEAEIDAAAAGLFDEFYTRGMPADDPKLQRIEALRRTLREEIPAAQRQITREIEDRLAAIRELVSDRTCIIGSSATGVGDFVPTPMLKRTPGALIHSNVLHTILTDRFVREAPWVANLLAILLAGAAVAMLTATRPIWLSGPLTLGLAGAYAAANVAAVFAVLNVWLVLWNPLAAMVAAFAVVTAYRQLTEERAKRRIRALFAHAMSPALVDRLIADPSLARLGGERREVTCFFSDLAGFTSLSERLGEQRTVTLLNRYFDRMSEIIQDRRGGYLNKFLGDGLLVFFGAPVFEDDHPRRAVEAALDCTREVAELNDALAAEFEVPVALSVRIGAATGEVMVGNCGSSTRMDYTAIGDIVNLASRLESANKFFHTGAIVTGETWRRSLAENAALIARPLGKVIVVGKTEPVEVFNPLGRRDEMDEATLSAAETFAAGVEQFQRGEFAAAGESFQAVLDAMGDDGAARVYLSLCREYAASPPGDAFDGAIRLSEK